MDKITSSIPQSMKALELRSYDGSPESIVVVERPVPRPAKGQVLVRIEAAPVHYHDLLVLRGLYGLKRKHPLIPGSEGSGVVVDSGKDFISRMLRGKKVVCGPDPGEDGTWAEYILTTNEFCLPLQKKVSLEQGSMMMINPLTAWVLIDMVRSEGHRCVVQTAAAGMLGRMIQRLANYFRIPVIHVVRREEQIDLLKSDGAEYILNSSEPDFDRLLKEHCSKLNATLAFDAVGGEMPPRLLEAMPLKSRVITYACLSDEHPLLHWRTVLFQNKSIQGFWLPNWLPTKKTLPRFLIAIKAQKFFARQSVHIKARFRLEDVSLALAQAKNGMTDGKILFTPANVQSSKP